MAQPSKKNAAPAPTASSRRGRPTADRAQAIDASIRAAALEIFLEAGFESANMETIAAKAPVSKGTLYVRYDSKEQLFRAVIEQELKRLSDRAGQKDHLLPPEVEGRLRHHARRVVEVFDWPQFRALDRLMRSVRGFPELHTLWQPLATERFIAFLAEDITRAADTGDLSRNDCQFYANLFVHGIMGWHQSQSERREVGDEEAIAFADRVVDMIMHTIRARQEC